MSVGSVGPQNKKSLDFELNLIPFIDLLSVCICFLLITAVWIQIGTMNTKQAVGGQALDNSNEKKPVLNVFMYENGDLVIQAKDTALPAKLAQMKLGAQAGRPDFEKLSSVLEEIKNVQPNLQTALIQPKAVTIYEDIMEVMDRFKKKGMINLGVSPL